MRHIRLALVAGVLFFAMGIKPDSAAASCSRGPYSPPTLPCFNIIFGDQELVYVDIHLPFAWMRNQPASNASIVYTILATGQYGVLRTKGWEGAWDGYQWWWPVELAANPSIHGWIEQASIGMTGDGQIAMPQDYNPTVSAPPSWTPYSAVQLKPGIPFAWIRYLPGSSKILAAVGPNSIFILFGWFSSSAFIPHFDGYQWWWPVQVTTANGVRNGWVEQNSIRLR